MPARDDSDHSVLTRLDHALLDLRRFAEAPQGHARLSVGTDDATIELSTVLVVSAVAREEPGECYVTSIAGALHVAHSTASRLVDRAVQAGMVVRERSDRDPRRSALSLTQQGRRLNREAVRFRTRRLEDILAGWSDDDVGSLTTLLERFVHCAHPRREEKP